MLRRQLFGALRAQLGDGGDLHPRQALGRLEAEQPESAHSDHSDARDSHIASSIMELATACSTEDQTKTLSCFT
jgi:hypothetical protein